MAHLLARAAVYCRNSNPELENCRYDYGIGAWIYEPTGEILVRSTFGNRPKPMTKKADMETGEDQK